MPGTFEAFIIIAGVITGFVGICWMLYFFKDCCQGAAIRSEHRIIIPNERVRASERSVERTFHINNLHNLDHMFQPSIPNERLVDRTFHSNNLHNLGHIFPKNALYIEECPDIIEPPECPLCISTITSKNGIRLACSHIFHWSSSDEDCNGLKEYIISSKKLTCPSCRHAIDLEENFV